ncbi:hypothetical protein Tco_1536458 [Tanacetum coccineum]
MEGLEAGIEHGKAKMDLKDVESYDVEVKTKYLAAVTDLENVPFPLLEDLVALKDSPIELLMASLTLEGGHGEED